MDWIERTLHVNPDGGSGSLELGITIGAAVAIAMVLVGVIRMLPSVRRLAQRLMGSNRDARPSSDRFDG